MGRSHLLVGQRRVRFGGARRDSLERAASRRGSAFAGVATTRRVVASWRCADHSHHEVDRLLIARPAPLIVLVLALAGCAARGPHGAETSPRAPAYPFPTDDQRMLACLDLQDHIVDLYANNYVTQEGLTLSAAERAAFRDGWAEELAKGGTFDSFEQSCFHGLTPRRYECGMQSQTPGSLVACMQVTSR
jgi:hypothetical protein